MVPITMVHCAPNEKLVELSIAAFEELAWFKTLIQKPTPMRAIVKEALVWDGMSRLWPYPDLEPFFQHADENEFSYFSHILLRAFTYLVCIS